MRSVGRNGLKWVIFCILLGLVCRALLAEVVIGFRHAGDWLCSGLHSGSMVGRDPDWSIGVGMNRSMGAVAGSCSLGPGQQRR